VCARIAYALDLDDTVAQQGRRTEGEMTMQEEEAVHTWWSLILLDKYAKPSIILDSELTQAQIFQHAASQYAKAAGSASETF
jgi:hypothetical protein